ncbi:hypothetical protein [Bacillus cereus group sp. TH253LC]|uniref:hypothetical protein n=1 Tax=Bacillus cereus group sp. TH253LC TaxID=3018043 RepID=UPI0022E98B0D|nr:hypothetical protein [Bacillus cereus group sp. TH253LC]MDA1547641.1 hypothetical protein [Bacillus cereus group sp. TH253LC]
MKNFIIVISIIVIGGLLFERTTLNNTIQQQKKEIIDSKQLVKKMQKEQTQESETCLKAKEQYKQAIHSGNQVSINTYEHKVNAYCKNTKLTDMEDVEIKETPTHSERILPPQKASY